MRFLVRSRPVANTHAAGFSRDVEGVGKGSPLVILSSRMERRQSGPRQPAVTRDSPPPHPRPILHIITIAPYSPGDGRARHLRFASSHMFVSPAFV